LARIAVFPLRCPADARRGRPNGKSPIQQYTVVFGSASRSAIPGSTPSSFEAQALGLANTSDTPS
jgi:hypothetical protein